MRTYWCQLADRLFHIEDDFDGLPECPYHPYFESCEQEER